MAAARPWVNRGYTVYLPSFRRPPRQFLPGIVADCRAALAAVAPREGVVDLQIGGMSSGGHLAALLALQPQWWLEAGWTAAPGRALLCSAPLELGTIWPRPLFGRWPTLDPGRLVGPAAAELRWLQIHGTADRLVPYRHAAAFHRRLREAGAPAELLTVEGGNHLAGGEWMIDGRGREVVERFIGAE